MFLVKFFHNKFVLFCWASLTGIFFALVWNQYESSIAGTLKYYNVGPSQFNYHGKYVEHLRKLGLASAPLRPNSSREVTEDMWLFQHVPVLCVILSKRSKSSRAVKNTWGKHCNRAIYFGYFDDAQVPVTKVTGKGDWVLLCNALTGAYKGYGSEFNWTLVVDDETFAVVENVRYLVAALDPQVPSYMGHAFSSFSGQYNILDAGFVVNVGALKAFDSSVEKKGCVGESAWHSSDKTFGAIMKEAGILPRDTRDLGRKARFLSQNLDKLLIPGSMSLFSRYWSDSVHLSPEGSGCCSDFAITFHGLAHTRMYMMEYVTYHLKPITTQRWRSIYEMDAPPLAVKGPAVVTTEKSSSGKASIAELNYPGSRTRLKRVPTKKKLSVTVNVHESKFANQSILSSVPWQLYKRRPEMDDSYVLKRDDFLNTVLNYREKDLENLV